MRLSYAVTAVQLLAVRLVAANLFDSPSLPDINIDPTIEPLEALAILQQHAYDTLVQRDRVSKRDSDGCSLATATKRQDW
jgi:tyrosinase